MEKIFETIATPEWWVGVVIVGILINLAAAYLKPRLDQAVSSISVRWATRTAKQRRQRLERIERLRGNINEQLLTSFAEMRLGIKIIFTLVFFTSLVLHSHLQIHMYGVSLSYISGILMGILGISWAIRAMLDFGGIASEIREARRLEDRHDQTNA